jgi:hypothetical protein
MATQPYSINLDPRYGPLEVIDVRALAAACADAWCVNTVHVGRGI